MTLTQLLPTVNQLSHQDKLRLIHFLLLAVAKEEGCSLEIIDSENTLLEHLTTTDAVVWSPQTDNQSSQALSDSLEVIDYSPISTYEMMALADSGGSFDFWNTEPDLYDLADGEPAQ
jgi:hypothetical protein